MKKKAIIFDLDGTLINSLPDISASMNRSLAKYGLPGFEENAYMTKVGNGVFKIAERSVGERTDLLEDVLHAYMEDYAKNCMVNTYAYQGVPEMLCALRDMGLNVCVLSNKDQGDVENVLRFCFPDFTFAVARGRVEGVPLKPDPAGALLIADQLGLQPGECWYAGDTSMDMRCGNGAGMETIGLTWGYRPRQDLVDACAAHIVDTPDMLLKVVREESV